MNNRGITALAFIVLAACTTTTPEEQFIEDAAGALGGRDRVSTITSVVMEARGSTANLGQDMTWEATGQSFILSDVRRALDLAGRRARTEQTRTPNFLYFQGPQPQRQILGIDGDVAYTIGSEGNATRQSTAVARDRRVEMYFHPLSIVRAMLEAPQAVANVRTEEGSRLADVTVGETTFVVRLDGNARPVRVSAPGSHPNLGDVTIETRFADYQPVEGLMLPKHIVTHTDRHQVAELRVERYALGDSSVDLTAPAAAASAPAPSPAVPTVDATPVAKGIWILAGQSHHSALVEFADHLTLIEVPQSEARALAVMAKARELVPNKPLTELVMSHHHFDHSAGLRAAVSEGLAVITHQANAAFVKEMVERSHTRQPDALARNPRPLTLRPVDGELTLQDETMTVIVYPLPDNPHGDTMVMAYVPRERLVIEADAFSPGGNYHPYAANLLEAIRTRKLTVDRIVPLHGAVVTLAELGKAVESQ
jgi:glyoxylase-like metal-dependent hydrolase (beta-lactamase superfamily II)